VIPAVAAGACGGSLGEWSRASACQITVRACRTPFACDASAATKQSWGGLISSRRPSYAASGLAAFGCVDVDSYCYEAVGVRP
jgi:hypothetical protein